jgi:hypothetical protein
MKLSDSVRLLELRSWSGIRESARESVRDYSKKGDLFGTGLARDMILEA